MAPRGLYRRPSQDPEPCGRVEMAQTCSKLVADRFEAKFHYASGSKLVADRFEAGRGPASSCYFAASKLDDRPIFSSLQVCDQL